MKIAAIIVLCFVLACSAGCRNNIKNTATPRGTLNFYTLPPSNSLSPIADESPSVTPTEEVTPSPSTSPTPSPELSPTKDPDTLDNTSEGWGFVRVKGDKPQFTNKKKQLMEHYNGVYLGNTDEKILYLTFDLGYENGYTEDILDTLKDKNVKAAFFITGSYYRNNRNIVERIINEGHILGNHTMTHPSLPSVSTEKIKNEVMGLHNSVLEDYGYAMKYLRPPAGEYSERSLAVVNSLGYRSTFWSLAYKDWETNNQKGEQHAYNSVMDYIHNGCVILLHAVSKDNRDALARIITDAQDRGYVFKTLDEYQ